MTIVSSHLLSFITSFCPSSTVSSCFLSFIAGDSPLSSISSSGSLYLIIVISNNSLFTIFDNSFLSLMPPTSFQVLFLPNTLSHICHSSVPFLPLFYSFSSLSMSLACHSTLFIEKKTFNQVLIAQKLLLQYDSRKNLI